MKSILCVLSLMAILLLVFANDIDDKRERLCYANSEKCRKLTKATDTDVENMCDKKLPTTRTGKCFMDCMMRQYKFLNDDGFQEKEFMNLIRMASTSKDYIQVAQELSHECKDVRDPRDKCETAFLVLQCMVENANRRGYIGKF